MIGYGVWSAGSETFEFLRAVRNPGQSDMLPEHTKANLAQRSDVSCFTEIVCTEAV